jgi:superfamily II DNA helicase RecQ
MVYVWGLVASGAAKKIKSHLQQQDWATFRPSYGKLGPKLVLTNGVPILLLSATCRPIAITSILKSLKLTRENISISRAELTQPKIRIIHIQMQPSLKSCNNVKHLYGPRNQTPNEKVIPGLVYSTTRHLDYASFESDQHCTGYTWRRE